MSSILNGNNEPVDEFTEWITTNVYAAIAALQSERYYEFTDGLLALLDRAKFNDRLLQSLLSGAAGVPQEESKERLRVAKSQNTWY